MPRVSVIMPAYNHEKYVREALQSVLHQSFQDFEIVVTDDGSRDNTSREVLSIDDPRISLETFPTNRGACVAGNNCIRRAKGEFIALLNSDDIYLPGKLERQVAFLDANPSIAAVFAWPEFIDENGKRSTGTNKDSFLARVRNMPKHAWLRHFFAHGNALCHPSMLIRKRCYTAVGYYNEALAQLPDLELWVRLLRLHDIHLMEEPLVGFRIRDGQMNASAARPEVVVRDQWEWRKVLDQYLALDQSLLLKVFPEIPLNVRSRHSFVARLALKALGRFVGDERLSIGASAPTSVRGGDQMLLRWSIAQIALAIGKPAHVLFALDLMYECLKKDRSSVRLRHFIDSTGKHDPYGMLSRFGHRAFTEYVEN